MVLVLEQVKVEGIAQLSYLVGDDKAGVAAVIDPRRDVDVYLQIARSLGVRITHIIESHIHADFVSGSHELQARIGAPIYTGKSDDYQFDCEQLNEEDELHLGKVTLRVLHTPGHTPEHISLLVFDSQQGEEPFGIFTGDTIFNKDVGRPDLLGGGTEKDLAAKLYHSLFDKILPLGDRLELYPCHGAGSSCGKSIGDRDRSTIGNERVYSDAFKQRSEEEFVEWILSDLPEPPTHYPRLKKVNAKGAKVMGCIPTLQPLSVDQFKEKMAEENVVVIDTRSILAFGGGHIPNVINIPLHSIFPTWVGWTIDPEKEILLVVERKRDLCSIAEQLFRLGYDNLAGYLHNGMLDWQNAGLPLQRVGEMTVRELNRHKSDRDLTILDVRSDGEYKNGFIPGAKHVYVPHLEEHLRELDKNRQVVVYCATGYRASLAASILQKHGFERVSNVPGSWKAWKSAELPVEQTA